jgi:hypothetical protein
MRQARQGRQRIARLFFRKRWLLGRKRSFGLAICPQERYNFVKPVSKKEIPGQECLCTRKRL